MPQTTQLQSSRHNNIIEEVRKADPIRGVHAWGQRELGVGENGSLSLNLCG